MALPLLLKKDHPLDRKLKSIKSQSDLIGNSIKRLERDMQRKAASVGTAPSAPDRARSSGEAPVRADAARPAPKRTHSSGKLGKYLATGSFQGAGVRDVPDRVRRNRRIFFTVLGFLILIILLWFLM